MNENVNERKEVISRTKEDYERLECISNNLAAIVRNVNEIMRVNSEMRGIETWSNGFFAYQVIEYAVKEAQSKVEAENLLLLDLES